MKSLLFGSALLLGAWLTQLALQVDHEPEVPAGTPATTPTKDDQKPATTKGGSTMR